MTVLEILKLLYSYDLKPDLDHNTKAVYIDVHTDHIHIMITLRQDLTLSLHIEILNEVLPDKITLIRKKYKHASDCKRTDLRMYIENALDIQNSIHKEIQHIIKSKISKLN